MVLRKCIALIMVILLCWSSKVYAQCGTENLASGKTVITSANSGSSVGNNITDGVNSTFWQPIYSSSNYAYIDLGSVQKICRVVVKWRYSQAASSFKIQMTNTPAIESSWVEIAGVESNNPANETTGPYSEWAQVNDFNITATENEKQYIRIWVGTIEYASWTLGEFQVYKANSNALPSAGMTNPNANIIIPVNTPLTLTASATDPNGYVTQVSFYNGTTLLGNAPQTNTSATNPITVFTYQWTPSATGTYSIKAVATDNQTGTGESLPVTVTVVPPTTGWSLAGNATTGITNPFLGTSDAQPLIVKTNNTERMRVTTEGRLVIGTSGAPTGAPADALLAVKGQIWARVLKVTQQNWPDYVFEKNYALMPLAELATYIRKYKHLPGVPSVKEVSKGGINVGDNQAMLLKKIEELTLYLLEQNRKIEMLLKKSDDQQQEIEKLKKK